MKLPLIVLAATAALAACSSGPPACHGEVFPLNPGRVATAVIPPSVTSAPPAEAVR